MISFAGIRKQFGTLDALKDVSFETQPGAITALVGPNASGKTTLLKIALGLTRPSSGEVRVAGVPVDEDGNYRNAIGYMPQLARFPDNLAIGEVLELVSAFRPAAVRDEELVRTFGLDADPDKRVRTLSGGTRQKLNAAIAFLFRPSLLILDEPTAGLDPVSSGILKDKIRRVRAEGRTVIVTSHVLAELEDLADDVAFLCDGSLQFVGSVAALLDATRQTHLEPAIAALMESSRLGRPRTAGDTAAPASRPALVTV